MSTATQEPTAPGSRANNARSMASQRGARSRRPIGVILVMLIGFFSLGTTASAANASERFGAAEYLLEVDGRAYTLREGETATFTLQRVASPSVPGQMTPDAVYPGDAGTLTVTGSGGSFHYSISMSIPATSFTGSFSVTDVSHGLSGGTTIVSGFSGSVPTSRLRGHRYSGALTGTAFLVGVPVATVVPNYTLYTYTG